MSIAGGLENAIERACAVEATALQIFVKSSNQWAARPFAPGEVDRYRAAGREADLERYTMAHSSYLINLASPKPELLQRSREALGVELDRCRTLGVPYLVLHPGSHVGQGEEVGLAAVATSLDAVLGRGGVLKGQDQVMVLLETTAGQGTNLGARFEHMAEIREQARCRDRLGVCIDTCHLLAAGYEFRDRRSYLKMMREFDSIIGLSHLRGVHLNDSKNDLGSRKDRHEHIGEGYIGAEPFGHLLNDKKLRDIPMVLETPKQEDLAEDRRNLAVLRGLVRS
jgi:deoxyribonuclease-4